MDQIVAVGRRKRAVARVFVKPGTGKFEVNKRDLKVYFPLETLQMKILAPFDKAEKNAGEYDIRVNVDGGGVAGQAEAVRLGVSRALLEVDADVRPELKRAGFLTRDSRKVERKKYGKKKARKSTQFSKR